MSLCTPADIMWMDKISIRMKDKWKLCYVFYHHALLDVFTDVSADNRPIESASPQSENTTSLRSCLCEKSTVNTLQTDIGVPLQDVEIPN